ncbi:hypothetical protein [Thermosynechococcus vestitus]|uniref:hypothetical protein n=1 Tax=Thermosynechococcus vestitus TaxID=146786 RepID=UPI0013E8A612|nr:hypothetical protein [Thermosynechococcus vestitus]
MPQRGFYQFVSIPLRGGASGTQFTRLEVGTAVRGVPEPNVTIEAVLRRPVIFQEAHANHPTP